MPDQYKHLLSPIDVGPFTLRNRVLVTAHVPGIETNGQVNDAYIRYHIGKTMVLDSKNQYKNQMRIGFENERELSYFMLACPHLKY